MSVSTEIQHNEQQLNNSQATASLALGLLSLIFFAIYLVFPLGTDCLASVAAILAFAAGFRGLRFAKEHNGQGRPKAIIGMVTGAISLAIFIMLFISISNQTQQIIDEARTSKVDQTFQSENVTLVYPGKWRPIDISQQSFCQQPEMACLLGIRHSSGDGTNLNLIQFTLNQEVAVEEIDAELWAKFEANTDNVTVESTETIEVDGQTAIKRIFHMPSSSNPNEEAYILQTYIVKDNTLYQFTGWTPGEEAMTQYQAEIEQIISSLSFTS